MRFVLIGMFAFGFLLDLAGPERKEASVVLTEEFLTAVKQGDANRVKSMLDASPSLAALRDEKEVSAPLLALYYRKQEVADLLLARKEAQDPLDVFEAAAFGRVDRLKELLTGQPALANAYAADGFYPLGLAAFYGHGDAAALLLSRGADPNLTARNTMKVRALHAASASRSLQIAKDLIAAGADVNAPQQEGFTPLHEASATAQIDLARLLLDKGADPNVKTVDGRTPLTMARKAGGDAMVELLVSRGARE